MRVIVAVYTVPPANVESESTKLVSFGDPLHAIIAVYFDVAAIVAVGVAPVTGAVTPSIAAVAIDTGVDSSFLQELIKKRKIDAIRITPEILNTFFIIYKLIDLTDHYWFDRPKVLGDSEDDLKLKIFNKYLRNPFKMPFMSPH